jgi:hypothetical protein
MALATYSDLKTTVANYLARSDLSSQIPDFIRLAEIRLRRQLRIREMLKLSSTTMYGGVSTVALPGDFLQMRNLYLDGNPETPIAYLSPASFTRNAFVTSSGLPINYTILSNEMQFAPVSDSDRTLLMLYYSAPTFLSDTTTTNTFMNVCPDLLLYGALTEAEPYLMNDTRIQTWAALFQRSLQDLNTSDEQAEYSGNPMVMTVQKR